MTTIMRVKSGEWSSAEHEHDAHEHAHGHDHDPRARIMSPGNLRHVPTPPLSTSHSPNSPLSNSPPPPAPPLQLRPPLAGVDPGRRGCVGIVRAAGSAGRTCRAADPGRPRGASGGQATRPAGQRARGDLPSLVRAQADCPGHDGLCAAGRGAWLAIEVAWPACWRPWQSKGLAAAGLAAAVADQDYTLRIEEVKTYQLEWIVPLAGALAVALAPAANDAVNRRRQSLPAPMQISVAPARNGKPVSRLAQPPVPATVPALNQDSSWTWRFVMTMAETALTAAVDQGSTMLRQRMPGVTGSAAAWAFNQGGSLARRRLLPQAAAALTSLEMRRPAQTPRDSG